MSVTTEQHQADQTGSNYVPLPPYPVTTTSVLTQNYVASDGVLLSSNDSNAVAAFCNPLKQNLPESFAIVQPEGQPQQVVYAAQDSTQPTGWTVAPLPDGPAGGAWPATGVVAAVNGSPGGLVDLFWNDGSALQHTWLRPDGTFATPQVSLGVALQQLGVTYLTPADKVGPPVPIVYGISSSGTVYLLSWNGTSSLPWAITQFTGSGFSSSSPLTVAAVSGLSGFPKPQITTTASVFSGNRYFRSVIRLGADSSPTVGNVTTWSSSPATPQSVIGQAISANGALCAYILGNDGVPYTVPVGGKALPGIVPVPAPSATVLEATIVPQPDVTAKDGTLLTGLVNMYLVHEAPDGTTPNGTVNLSLLRQIGWTNGGMLPQWAPPVPIATAVAGVFPILNPGDPDTVFLADRDNESALAVYSRLSSAPWRNPSTRVREWSGGPHWSGGDIRQASTTTYEVSSYVVRATVTDSNSMPMSGYPLELSASSACGVIVGTSNFPVGPQQSTPIATDSAGVATFAIEASDFCPPSLILTDPAKLITGAADLGPNPVSISPAASIQTYMSTSAQATANGSTGVLPYLPPASQTFSPTMMTSATIPDGSGAADSTQPLFPGVQGGSPLMPAGDAVTNVNNMMALGYDPVEQDEDGRTREPTPGPAGFIINNSDPTRPAYVTFESGAAMRAAWQAQHSPRMHLFHDAGDLFSDTWKGIKSGATKVADVAVDMEKGVVSMAIWIGNEATEIGNFVITCVEDACNAIAGVFSALESAIKDIIKFLKALFDFGNIFDTQWAFTQSLNQGLFTAAELVQWATQELDPSGSGSTSFFSGMLDRINASFVQAEAQYGGQSVAAAAGPGWQPMGQPPSNTQTIEGSGPAAGGGAITPAQLVANPQALWLQNQLGAQMPTSSSTDDLAEFFAAQISPALQAAIDAFSSVFAEAVKDFEGGVTAFEAGFTDLADAFIAAVEKVGGSSPNDLQNVPMIDLLKAENEFVVGMLDFADAIALSFLALADAGITWLLDTINSPIPKGHGSPIELLGEAVQLIYDGLWDVARLKWTPPKGGWTPPAGSSIPNWNPQDGMPKELTYAGIGGLTLGFPFTVLYEIITGKPPFPGGALAGADPGPEIDQHNYAYVGFGSDLLIGLLTTTRDILIAKQALKPEPATGEVSAMNGAINGLSLLTMVVGVASFIFKWPPGDESWKKSTEAKAVAMGELMAPAGALAVFLLFTQEGMTARSFGLTFSSFLGVGSVIYATVLGFEGKHKVPPKYHGVWQYETTIGMISPMSMAMSFLLMPAMQEATDDIPFAAALKVLIDVALLDLAVPTLDLTEILTQPTM